MSASTRAMYDAIQVAKEESDEELASDMAREAIEGQFLARGWE